MTFDEEIVSELGPLIESGLINVEPSSDRYFVRLNELYPASGSKIDWQALPCQVEYREIGDAHIADCLYFIKKGVSKEFWTERCVVIGDSAIEIVLKMSIATLAECIGKLLEIPQHLYVVAEDYSWCICFSMEGYMSFGTLGRMEQPL